MDHPGGSASDALITYNVTVKPGSNQEISAVMTRENLVTVPPGTTLESAKELLHEHREGLICLTGGARSALVRRLREKVERDPSEPRHIITVWGLGYRFDP